MAGEIEVRHQVGQWCLLTFFYNGAATPEIYPLTHHDALPISQERLANVLGKLRKRPFVNAVLSADRQLAVVALTVREDYLSSADRTRLVRSLEREKVTVESGGRFQVQLAGYPVHRVYFAEHIASENRRLLPWALAVVVTVLAMIFRSWVGVLAPLVGAVLAVLWTRGLMALTGLAPNIFAPALFLLVGLMAVSHSVHLLARHRKKIGEGQAPRAAAREPSSQPCPVWTRDPVVAPPADCHWAGRIRLISVDAC